MVCDVCGYDKPLVADRGKDVRRCVECAEENYQRSQRTYYQLHKEHVKRRTTIAQASRVVAWVNYFKKVYGLVPYCECCGKALQWPGESAEKFGSVHFDHRHGGEELIKGSPTKWLRSRQPTEQNIKTFHDCDFGLLCTDCNRCLPTMDRGDWLMKALEYYGKTKTYDYR